MPRKLAPTHYLRRNRMNEVVRIACDSGMLLSGRKKTRDVEHVTCPKCLEWLATAVKARFTWV